MMKKIFCWILALTLVLAMTGCGRTPVRGENTVQIYYLNSEETRVVMEDYNLSSTGREERIEELLERLKQLPEKHSLKAPLAMGFEVLETNFSEGKLTIDVDEHYKSLPLTTEVLVRGAIVRTLTQLEGVNYIEITVNSNQLFDGLGELVGWMNGEQFIQNDGNEINTYEPVRIKLFFANESGDGLIGAYREKHYSTNTPLERFVVEETIAGPSGQVSGLYATVNPTTKILNIMTKDGICYVNLDDSFLTVPGNSSLELAVYSIVNALVELNSINKVQILVNGEIPESLHNSVYERNLDIVTTL